ncbi:unnamed protein product [Cochlearia groenlandica]
MDGVQKEQDEMDAPRDIVNSSIVNVHAEKVSNLVPCQTSFTALLVGVENYGLSPYPMDDIDADELVRVVEKVEEQAKRDRPMYNETIQSVQPTLESNMMSSAGLRAHLMSATILEGYTETNFDGDIVETGWNDAKFSDSEDEEEDYKWDEMHEFVRNDRALLSESEDDDDDYVDPPPQRPEKKKKKATPATEPLEQSLAKSLK